MELVFFYYGYNFMIGPGDESKPRINFQLSLKNFWNNTDIRTPVV